MISTKTKKSAVHGPKKNDFKELPCLTETKVSEFEKLEKQIVNHEPYTNHKRVYAQKFEIPDVTQIGVATFNPGTDFPLHHHSDMFELFYVLSGRGEFTLSERNPKYVDPKYLEPDAQKSDEEEFNKMSSK